MRNKLKSVNKQTSILAIAALSASLILWSLYFTFFWSFAFVNNQGTISARSMYVWADGSAHLSYTSSLAHRTTFPSKHPLYINQPLTYPFAADALSALLVKAGFTIFTAYSLVGIILSLLFLLTLTIFYYQFLKKPALVAFSLNLFLLFGGLGFYQFFLDVYHSGFSVIWHLPYDYTHMPDVTIRWLNVTMGELLPQRAFLLSLPIGLTILTILWKFLAKPKSLPRWKLALTGSLYGLLPIIHPHTMIALSVPIFWVGILSITRKQLSKFFFLAVPALIISLPLIITFSLPATSQGFFRLHPGWLAKSYHLNWFWFWFLNWGLLPLIVISGLPLLSKNQKHFFISATILFTISNLVLFQPHDWDNSKVLTWTLIIFIPTAAQTLFHLAAKSRLHQVFVIFLTLSLTLAGSVDVIRQIHPSSVYGLFSPEELTLAQTLRATTPTDSIFLTSDQHNHPIPTLTGRQIIMGYRGWLWTYGIDYTQTEQDVAAMYTSPATATNLFNQYQIDYAVIGPSETHNLHANKTYFDTHFPIHFKTKNYTIYQISPLTSTPTPHTPKTL